MTELTDHELLAQYARTGSEAAFAVLVARYLNLVHSAAWRYTDNTQQAEEISQTVFMVLAQKASRLSRSTVLSGWLYQTARLTAANFVKRETRRQNREQEAYMQSNLNESSLSVWRQIAPELDEAMGRLGETDRTVLVLRFFEKKTNGEVAKSLDLAEGAVQRRALRALEKLRIILVKLDVTLSATAIAGAVAANSVQAAPAQLARKIVLSLTHLTMPGFTINAILASLPGKALLASGSIAALFIGAMILVQTDHSSKRGAIRQGSPLSDVTNNPVHASNAVSLAGDTSQTISVQEKIKDENAKLGAAISHLQLVLHTRPKSDLEFDRGQIESAIEDFGLYRRAALNVLLENANDPVDFVRSGAIFGMGYVGKFLPEVPPSLWDMVYSSSVYDRLDAFQALIETRIIE